MSTRYRGEPPPKRKRLTPSPPPTIPPRSKTQPRPSLATEAREVEMPTKVKEENPLPTLDEPQEVDLPDDVFQTISESGVLKESLDRSRRKWMDGGVFERYWTKPTKKKGAPELQQPAKESMSRVGNCTMVVGPHTFDLTLYSVKEHQPAIQFPTYPQTPQSYSHYSPYPQSGTYTSTYGPPFTGSVMPDAVPPRPLIPVTGEVSSNVEPAPPPVAIPPVPSPNPPPSRRMSKSSNSSSQDARPGRDNNGPSTDPVIQMLAQRAGQDPRLKSLMTIVAAGDASAEQLKEFQSHIDELNNILKSPKPKPSTTPPAPAPAPSPVKVEPPAPARPPYSIPPYAAPSPRPPPLNPYLHAPPPPPTAIPGPVTLVFDFSGPGSNGDRYLFPKQGIIEYQPGHMSLLASFLVVKSGSVLGSREGGHYKSSKQYYEPLTIKMSAPNQRILEPVARAVKPPNEVREYMETCFRTMERARKTWLAKRLPRERKGSADDIDRISRDAEGSKAGGAGRRNAPKEMADDADMVKSVYDAPSSMMPL